MSKEMMVIALGIWIVVVPYLGVPGAWRTTILIISGVTVALLGFLLRGEAISRGRHSEHQPFVENKTTLPPLQ